MVIYATLQPDQIFTQQTYSGHDWNFTVDKGSNGPAGAALRFRAPSHDCTVVIEPDLHSLTISHRLTPYHVLHGCAVRAKVHNAIVITAAPEVADEAIESCAQCISSILDAMPERKVVLKSMAALGVEIAVIGSGQATTDVPAHKHLRGQDVRVGPARTFDEGTRGLGATVACPVMSVGEENLLPRKFVDPRYPDESILVHEFAHTVLSLGLKDTHWYEDIKDAYAAARRSNAYDLKSYCMENADEYWAEMTQAWFSATRRLDVTSGITSPGQLVERDPRLAAIMFGVYGDPDAMDWTWQPSDGITGGWGTRDEALNHQPRRSRFFLCCYGG